MSLLLRPGPRVNPKRRFAISPLPRRIALALFRLHIENGMSVAVSMAAVGVGSGLLFGRDVAVLAATGAWCVSVVDQPAPVATNARIFAAAVAGTTLITFLAALAQGSPLALGLLVAAMSMSVGLITVFGRRALGLGVAAVLALMFGMAGQGTTGAVMHAGIFAAGGVAYAAVALSLASLLDDRNRRLFLGEAMRAFSRYVAAKAELYDPHGKPRPALQHLVEAHADLVERLQAARDTIFAGRRTRKRARWIAALLALLDCFDTTLSSDADVETLRNAGHPHLMRRIRALTNDLARDVEALTSALVTHSTPAALESRKEQFQAIGDEVARLARAVEGSEPLAISAFRSTYHKLVQTAMRLHRLADAIGAGKDTPQIPDSLDLSLFMQAESISFGALKAQMTLSSPILRYAIRLTLAMTSAYLLTLIVPRYVHGGWVLLTTALILRANYSITRRRRDDRVVGNLIGCVATALLIFILPPNALAVCIVLAIGAAHAFGAVDYRVTAFAACVSALLQLQLMAPAAHPLFLERMLDTLIGAGLAWGFSYVLPSWERRRIPRLVAKLVAADRAYADAALSRALADQSTRLARKQAHDAAANLSMTVRRLADEPQLDRRALVALNELLAANYLLASDLASMRVLFRLRKDELDPKQADELLAGARKSVAETFAASGATKPGAPQRLRQSLGDLGGANATVSLRRRLVYVERAAKRVADLAVRALREV
jgi:uncharacterized membrane protein YccC